MIFLSIDKSGPYAPPAGRKYLQDLSCRQEFSGWEWAVAEKKIPKIALDCCGYSTRVASNLSVTDAHRQKNGDVNRPNPYGFGRMHSSNAVIAIRISVVSTECSKVSTNFDRMSNQNIVTHVSPIYGKWPIFLTTRRPCLGNSGLLRLLCSKARVLTNDNNNNNKTCTGRNNPPC
jgi:hypothetical protein